MFDDNNMFFFYFVKTTQFVCLAVCFLEYVKNIEIRGLCCKIVLEKGCDNLRYLHKKFKLK